VRGAPRRVNQAALSIPRKVPGGGVAMRGTRENPVVPPRGCTLARRQPASERRKYRALV